MSEALDNVISSVFDRHHQYAAMEAALEKIIGGTAVTNPEELAKLAVATVARLRAELAALRGTLCDPTPSAPSGAESTGIACAKCHKLVTVGGFLSDGRQSCADCAEPPRAPEPTARDEALERAEVLLLANRAEMHHAIRLNQCEAALRALLAAIRATDGAR